MTLTLIKTQSTNTQEHSAQKRQDWEQDAALLADDVERWVRQETERGWQVTREDKELAEESLGGVYHVPVMTIAAPQGRLILEPVARETPGSQGRIDLYAWPSLFRVMLLHKPGGGGDGLMWVVRTESGLDWPQPWNRETFFVLAEGLLNA